MFRRQERKHKNFQFTKLPIANINSTPVGEEMYVCVKPLPSNGKLERHSSRNTFPNRGLTQLSEFRFNEITWRTLNLLAVPQYKHFYYCQSPGFVYKHNFLKCI